MDILLLHFSYDNHAFFLESMEHLLQYSPAINGTTAPILPNNKWNNCSNSPPPLGHLEALGFSKTYYAIYLTTPLSILEDFSVVPCPIDFWSLYCKNVTRKKYFDFWTIRKIYHFQLNDIPSIWLEMVK